MFSSLWRQGFLGSIACRGSDRINQLARFHRKPLGWLSGEKGRDPTAGGQGTNRGLIGAAVSLAGAIAADLASPSGYSNAIGTASVEFNRSGTFQIDPFLAAQVEPFALLFALNLPAFLDAPLQF